MTVSTLVRLALLLLAARFALQAELLEVRIRFDDGGCLSCAESLEQRLARVRGVETVELDLEGGFVALELEEGNRVRLLPLLSRVEQGGAKALETSVLARGSLRREGDAWLFQPSGLTREYTLEGDVEQGGEDVRIEATVVDVRQGLLKLKN